MRPIEAPRREEFARGEASEAPRESCGSSVLGPARRRWRSPAERAIKFSAATRISDGDAATPSRSLHFRENENKTDLKLKQEVSVVLPDTR